MKVRFDASPDSKITVQTDPDSGLVLSVLIEPMFTKKLGKAVLTYGTALKDNGDEIERFDLVASGQTGRVTKIQRGAGVVAAIDGDETPKGKKKADE